MCGPLLEVGEPVCNKYMELLPSFNVILSDISLMQEQLLLKMKTTLRSVTRVLYFNANTLCGRVSCLITE